MTFRFKAGELVVNMTASTDMTVGRVYRVVNSYDGHSGCGAQEWCRVPNDRGDVVGYDPDRFIPFVAEKAQTALGTALRLRGRLKAVLKGLPRDGVMASLHGTLADMLEDATDVVAVIAQPLDPDQIILNCVGDYVSPITEYEVRIGEKVIAYFIVRGLKSAQIGRARYSVIYGDQEYDLQAADYKEATDAVRAWVREKAEGDWDASASRFSLSKWVEHCVWGATIDAARRIAS